jgi:hypothetical protein
MKPMHAVTKAKLEEFAGQVKWSHPHPLQVRKFDLFVIEAYRRGDTRITLDEFTHVIERYAPGVSDRDLCYWMARYERGIDLLRVAREIREKERT